MNKVILTGVSSFVGYHLGKSLSENFEVLGTHSKNQSAYEGVEKERMDALSDKISFKQLDITNHSELEDLIKSNKPDYFIHHAGYTLGYGGFDYDMAKSLEVNVYPLDTLVRSLKENGCKGLIVTGTSMEYSDGEAPRKEEDLCEPSTPYGLSKLTETLRSLQLAKHHNLPLRVARIFNPMGEFENPRKLLPFLVENLKSGNSTELSPCEQIRTFEPVENIVKVYVALIRDLDKGGAEIFNATLAKGLPLKDTLAQIATNLDRSPELLQFGKKPMRPGEVHELSADLSKIQGLGLRTFAEPSQIVGSFPN